MADADKHVAMGHDNSNQEQLSMDNRKSDYMINPMEVQSRSRSVLWLILLLFVSPISCAAFNSSTPTTITSTYGEIVELVWEHVGATVNSSTPTTVTSTYGQNVEIEWKHEGGDTITDIVVTRSDQSKQIEKVCDWSTVTGIQPDPFFITSLKFNKRIEDQIHIMSLTLVNAVSYDFSKTYHCRINTVDNTWINKTSIYLHAERPSIVNYNKEINVTVGQDVIFQYQYQYRFLAIAVVFRQKNSTSIRALGFWYNDAFTKRDPFKDRLEFNKTRRNKTSETLELILKNVKLEDFDLTYDCLIIFGDGQEIITEATLTKIGKPIVNYTKEINAIVGQDVIFQYQYQYRLLAEVVVFRQKNSAGNIIQIGSWHKGTFEERGLFKDRLEFHKTQTHETCEMIELILKNVTQEDLDLNYECLIILQDGQEIITETTLTKIDRGPIQRRGEIESPSRKSSASSCKSVVINVSIILYLILLMVI